MRSDNITNPNLTGLLLAGLLYFIFPGYTFAQNDTLPIKCALEEFEKYKASQELTQESTAEFESWMAKQLSSHSESARSPQEVVTIPVVVHIIHNGEPIGSGINLPVGQIESQIQILNEDFRRQNEDRTNTPEAFLPIAADTEIQFVLARRDPEGLATNGIVRVNGGQSRWEVFESTRLKQLSYWPAEDYLNIWVTDIGSNFLGYAQFPVSSLDGLELGSENALSDGIVVDYMVFGSEALYPDANLIPAYNLGRTATHEVGHFFGLRHIWGDGGCSADDFVSDTPPAANDHGGLGIPCGFPGPNTCGNGTSDLPDMFQNYMDYTNDVCMNLFTEDQKARMLVVLENSPRRRSLITSKGGLPPVLVANDAGIRSLPESGDFLCNEVYIPKVEIRNYGTNALNSVEVRLLLNNSPVASETFSVTLDPLESTVLVFPPQALPSTGGYDITFSILSVNGTSDNNFDNDVESFSATLLPNASGILSYSFEEGLPAAWTILNPDGKVTWDTETAPFESPGNRSLFMNFYEYELEGEVDYWVSPVIDLTEAAGPMLSFDLSHARYPGKEDGLLITASSVCGDALFGSDTLFYKTGSELSTVIGSTTEAFFPKSPSEWRRERLDLSAYTGTNVRISFISINGYGNNLFIDNLRVDPGAVISLTAPGLVSCGPDITPSFVIQNNLNEDIASFDLTVALNESSFNYNVTLTPVLPPGESREIILESLAVSDGIYALEASISNINGSGITPPGKNTLTEYLYINSEPDLVPLREDFNQGNTWTFASSDGMPAWETVQTNYATSAYLDFSGQDPPFERQWIVSPVLDLTNTAQPFLVFDYAYLQTTQETDRLFIYVSTDCGETYEIYNSIQMETQTGVPASENDWKREVISLLPLAGNADVRLAIVGLGNGGGELFVDNIQVFVNEPVVFGDQLIYPNPTDNGRFNITVNLDRRQLAVLRVMDMQGRVVLVQELPNTLNQTYAVDLSGQAAGIYFVELRGETFSLLKRIMNTR